MAVSGQEDWYNIPELDMVDVLGNRGGGGFWNFGFDSTANTYDPFAGITPPADEAFAPPVPTVLPEVIVTAPRLAPPPPAPPPAPRPVSPIATVVTRVLTPLVGLLWPQPMGPRGLDEAPNALVLPEVTVRQPRLPPKKPPSLPPVAMEPFLPPNWDDLSRPGDLTRYEQPVPKPFDWFKLIDFATNVGKVLYDATRLDRPDTERVPAIARPRPRDPSPLGIPDYLRPVVPDIWTQPRRIAEPLIAPEFYPATPAPYIAPTIRPQPVDPRVQPRPGIKPAPRTSTDLRPINQPFSPLQPFLQPFFDPLVAPAPRNPLKPAPRTPAGPALRPVPFSPLQPFGTPMDPRLDPALRPADKVGRCSCPPAKTTKPKDKKKKSKEPREQCRQGTYTQRAKGIIYTPRRIVPCQ
jgi:hypothetical protein